MKSLHKVFSTFLAAFVIGVQLLAPVEAAETVQTIDLSQGEDEIVISKSTDTFHITQSKAVTDNRIEIEYTSNVTLILDGVNCEARYFSALDVRGIAKVILKDHTVNQFHFISTSNSGAGIEVSKYDGSLTITCEHSDEEGHVCDAACGTLIARGAPRSTSAGIGSDRSSASGPITILGGNITAEGSANGTGAGIGGGDASNITIKGGNVTAIGHGTGAGIGGSRSDGYAGNASNIYISGGNVTATGGEDLGTGIGAVRTGSVNNIQISGGTVTATGNSWLPGIGSGSERESEGYSRVSNVKITGGFVRANSANGENGIGCTDDGTNFIEGDCIVDAHRLRGIAKKKGLIFDGSSGAVYGENAIVPMDYTIESGKQLAVAQDQALTVPPGITLTVAQGAGLTNNGRLQVEGKLKNQGTYTENGTAEFKSTLDGSGTVKENGRFIWWLDLALGSVVLKDGGFRVGSTDYPYGGQYILHQPAAGTTQNSVLVEKDVSVEIVLHGIRIDLSGKSGNAAEAAFRIEDESAGNVTLTIADNTENMFKSKSSARAQSSAGLQKNGGTGRLTIQCEHAGEAGHVCGENCGKLDVLSGGSGAAGIGSSDGKHAGHITVLGGNITADGGQTTNMTYGAGIGSGSNGTASDVAISGGTVTARGGAQGGAGIGSGFFEREQEYFGVDGILISGGSITAAGGAQGGTGIGSSGDGFTNNVQISGGSITATGGANGGAGIGSDGGGASNIQITGGMVFASSRYDEIIFGARPGSFNDNVAIDGDCYVTLSGNESVTDLTRFTIRRGIVFGKNGVSAGYAGKVYGSATLPFNAQIGRQDQLTVPEDSVFTIAKGVTLQNDGIIQGTGRIIEEGTIAGNPPEGAFQYYLDLSLSSITITQNGYRLNGGEEHALAGPYHITQSRPEITSNRIYIDRDVTAELILENINISSTKSPIEIAENSTGTVTLTLADGSQNQVNVTGRDDNAGIEKLGADGELIFQCEHWSEAGHQCDDSCGSLIASAEANPAIGGRKYKKETHHITFRGGNITANGGSLSAGIGTGLFGRIDDVKISGGNIIANGGPYGGAGIGSVTDESSSSCGEITISGGCVTAAGGSGLSSSSDGIGGMNSGKITITGGFVTATGFTADYGHAPGAGIRGAEGSAINGDCVALASSLEQVTKTKGVVFEGAEGRIYGDSVSTVPEAVIPVGYTLQIVAGQTLVVAENTIFTNNGTIRVDGAMQLNGLLINNGLITGDGAPAVDNPNYMSMGNLDIGVLAGDVTIYDTYFTLDVPEEQEPRRFDYQYDFVISGSTLEGLANPNKVTVAGGEHTITLWDATIDVAGRSGSGYALTVKAGASVTLILSGENILNSTAGLEGILVEEGGSLTIRCSETGNCSNTACPHQLTVEQGLAGSGGIDSNGGNITVNGSAAAESFKVRQGNVTVTGDISGSLSASGGKVTANAITGAFSLAAGGSGVVCARTIDDQSYRTDENAGGIVMEGDNGLAFGGFALSSDLTVPVGGSLTVPAGCNITLGDSGVLLNKGTIYLNGSVSDVSLIQGDGIVVAVPEVSVVIMKDGVEAGQARYGDTITVKATVQKPPAQSNMLRSAAPMTMDFYLGEQKLNEVAVAVSEEAGTYTASFAFTLDVTPSVTPYAVTADFGGASDLARQTGSRDITVQKAEISNITSAGVNHIYDGAAYGIEAAAPGCTIYYSTIAGEFYSTQPPEFRDAGTYLVYYKVSKENYEDVIASESVTITPKPIQSITSVALQDMEKTDAPTVSFRQALLTSSDVVGDDVVRAEGTATVPSGANAGTYHDATVTVAAVSNPNYTCSGVSVSNQTYTVFDQLLPYLTLTDERVTVKHLKEDGVLIVACYGERGNLIDRSILPVTASEYDVWYRFADLYLNTHRAHRITAYLWKDLDTVRPLCQSETVDLIHSSK